MYTDKDWRAGGQAYGWALAYFCMLVVEEWPGAYTSPIPRLFLAYTSPIPRLYLAYTSPISRGTIFHSF